MSASSTQLSALALPAERMPPTTVAATRPERRDTACGQEHHRNRGQQQQLDDAWLGQRHVGTEDVAARDPPGGIGGHCQVELGVGRHGHLLVIAGDGLRGSLVMDWAPGSAPSGGRLLGRGASA
jgi:hypothetical protein